jgi:hypothetical protein
MGQRHDATSEKSKHVLVVRVVGGKLGQVADVLNLLADGNFNLL